MINHISWVIGNTVVEYLNEDDATELHVTSIQWMDEVDCPHILSEIAEFQGTILDRIFHLSDSSEESEEEERRNCNWCGYALLPEQTNPDLCGACFKQWLEEESTYGAMGKQQELFV